MSIGILWAYNYFYMTKYVALLRGINVGGKNKVPMSELKKCFEELGFQNVSTYINSGNVIFESDENASETSKMIAAVLAKNFKTGSAPIKVVTVSKTSLKMFLKMHPKVLGKNLISIIQTLLF